MFGYGEVRGPTLGGWDLGQGQRNLSPGRTSRMEELQPPDGASGSAKPEGSSPPRLSRTAELLGPPGPRAPLPRPPLATCPFCPRSCPSLPREPCPREGIPPPPTPHRPPPRRPCSLIWGQHHPQ